MSFIEFEKHKRDFGQYRHLINYIANLFQNKLQCEIYIIKQLTTLQNIKEIFVSFYLLSTDLSSIVRREAHYF